MFLAMPHSIGNGTGGKMVRSSNSKSINAAPQVEVTPK